MSITLNTKESHSNNTNRVEEKKKKNKLDKVKGSEEENLLGGIFTLVTFGR